MRATFVALVSFAAAVLLSAPARAQEPPGRVYVADDRLPPPSTRWKLLLGGVATTAAFYAVAQPFSYAWPDAPGGRDLRVPVAGPWLAFAHNGCASDNPGCSTVWLVFRGILTALDGIGQVGGVAIALEGVFVPTGAANEERTDFEPAPAKLRRQHRPDRTDGPGQPRDLFLAPAPMAVGQRGVGVGVVGVF